MAFNPDDFLGTAAPAFDPDAFTAEPKSSFDPAQFATTDDADIQQATDAKAKELAADTNFDPEGHASQHEPGSPQYELAYKAQQERDNLPLMQRLSSITPSHVGDVIGHTLKTIANLPIGAGTAVYSLGQQGLTGAEALFGKATGNENLERSADQLNQHYKAQGVLGGQLAETSFKGLLDSGAHGLQKLGALIRDKTGTLPDNPGAEQHFKEEWAKLVDNAKNLTPEEYTKQAVQLQDDYHKSIYDGFVSEGAKVHRNAFDENVANLKQQQQLANGQPLDTGVVAGVSKFSDSGVNPSELYSPTGLLASGAPPVDAEQVKSMGSAADPGLLAFAAAPELPGAATLGGGAMELTGKVFKAPASLIGLAGGKMGQVAKAASLGSAATFVAETALHNPALAVKLAAGAAATKGFQAIGEVLEQQGKELRTGTPSKFSERVAKSRATDTRDFAAEGQKMVGDTLGMGAAGLLSPTMLGVNALTSEGDPAKAVDAEITAGTFGGALSLLHSQRPILIEAIRPHLRDQGLQSMDTTSDLGKKSKAFLDGMDEAQRNVTLEIMGGFQGLGAENKNGTKSNVRIYPLSEDDFKQAIADHGGPIDAEAQGYFVDSQGKVFVNGDSELTKDSALQMGHTVGHETSHAAMNIMRAMGDKGSPLLQNIAKTAKVSLMPGGKPSRQFKEFLDSYNRAFPEEMADQRIDINDPRAIEEFLAETGGHIMANGIGDLAMPKNILAKLQDATSKVAGKFFGLDPKTTGLRTGILGDEHAAITNELRDSLAQIVGMKLNGQLDTAEPSTATPAAPAPPPVPVPDNTPVSQPHMDAIAALKAVNREDAANLVPTSPGTNANEIAANALEAANKAKNASPPAFAAPPEPVSPLSAVPTPEAAPVDINEAQRKQNEENGKLAAPVEAGEFAKPGYTAIQPLANIPADEPATAPLANTPVETATGVAEPPRLGTTPTEEGRQTPVVPTSQEVQEALGTANKATVGQKPEKVSKARQEALRSKLPNFDARSAKIGETAPDELHVHTDEFGKTSVRGTIDLANPLHEAFLKEAGLSKDQRQKLTDLQAKRSQVVYIDYGAAKVEAGKEHSAEQRAKELADSPAEGRTETTEQVNKAVIPLQTKIAANGKVSVVAYSPDKLHANALAVVRAANDAGFAHGYEGSEGEINKALSRDIKTAVTNHANGWSMDGQTKLRADAGPAEPFKDAQGNPLDPETARQRQDVLNMAANDAGATDSAAHDAKTKAYEAKLKAWQEGGEQGRKPSPPKPRAERSKVEEQDAQALARQKNGYLSPETGETNKLRDALSTVGFDAGKLESTIENLRPELIRDIRDQPNGDRSIVRAQGEPASRPPNAGYVRGGFMPKANTDSKAFKDWFKDSKIKDKDGNPLVVYHAGYFDESENGVPDIGDDGFHFGTERAAEDRQSAKHVDDWISDLKTEQHEGKWFWESGHDDSYDIRGEEGFASQAEAQRDAENYIASLDQSESEPMPTTKAYLSIQNPKRLSDHSKRSWAEDIKKAKAQGYDGIVYRNEFEDKGKDSYIAFDPSQIKSVNNQGTFDKSNPDIRFMPKGKKDILANSYDERGEPQSKGFKKWKGKATFYPMGENLHDLKSGQPVVIEGVHGTTHEVNTFEPEKATVENDWGKGIYVSNEPEDVAANYAGIGPDLTNRIEKLAEDIKSREDYYPDATIEDIAKWKGERKAKEWWDELTDERQREYRREYIAAHKEEFPIEKARELAKEQLTTHGGATMKVYVKLENPLKLGGKEEYWDSEMPVDEEGEPTDQEPTGKMPDFVNALQQEAANYGEDHGDMNFDKLNEMLYEGASVGKAIEAGKEAVQYATDDEGNLASNEIVRAAIERMGYDGIIDGTVNDKFGSGKRIGKAMEGMNPDTVHIIAFKPEQIKSATGNSGKFDPKNPDIRFMPKAKVTVEKFDEDNEDRDPWETLEKAEQAYKASGLNIDKDKQPGLIAYGKDGEPIGATFKKIYEGGNGDFFGDENPVKVYEFDIGINPKDQGGTVGYMLTKKSIEDAKASGADVMSNFVINKKMADMLENFFGFEHESEPSDRADNSAGQYATRMYKWLDTESGRKDLPKFMPKGASDQEGTRDDYSWMSQRGTIYPVKNTHSEDARRIGIGKGKDPVKDAWNKGYVRVTFMGGDLYAHREGGGLNSEQKSKLIKMAEEQGKDRVVFDSGDDYKTIWTADQGSFMPKGKGDILANSQDTKKAERFYSQLPRTVADIPRDDMTVDRAIGFLRKGTKDQPRVNENEIKLSGILTDPLSPLVGRASGDKVTKQELLDYATERQTKVEDITLGKSAEDQQRLGELMKSVSDAETQWNKAKADLRGRVNALPSEVIPGVHAHTSNALEIENAFVKYLEANPNKADQAILDAYQKADDNLTEARKAHYELDDKINKSEPKFADTSNLNTPGALPNSRKEIFVTYPKGNPEPLVDMGAIGKAVSPNEWHDGHQNYNDIINPIVRIRSGLHKDADGKLVFLIDEMQGPGKDQQAKMPPELRDNIYQIGFKRALREATDQGADKIAWTTGDTQVDRYDLSKQVGMASLLKSGDDNYVLYLEGLDKSPLFRNRGGFSEHGQKTVTKEELANTVGKDVAKKLIEGADAKKENPRTVNEFYDLKGTDLRVGGEGLRKLYDKTLPSEAKKFGDKFGVQVGKTKVLTEQWNPPFEGKAVELSDGTFGIRDHEGIPAGPEFDTKQKAEQWIEDLTTKSQQVHSMDIPEAMHLSQQEKGNPVFMPKPKSEELKADLEKEGYKFDSEVGHRRGNQPYEMSLRVEKGDKEAGRMDLYVYPGAKYKYGEIASVHVHSEDRGKGIAELLYREAAKTLQKQGIQRLHGDVMAVAPMNLRKKIFGKFDYVGDVFNKISEKEAKSRLPAVKDDLTYGGKVSVVSKIDPKALYMPKPRTPQEMEKKRDAVAQAAFMLSEAKKRGVNLDENPDVALDLGAQWRKDNPREESKQHGIPEGYLGQTPLAEEGVSPNDAVRSREALLESAPDATRSARRAAELRPLVEASKKADRVFGPELEKLFGAEGVEHQVVFGPQRVLKITHPGRFGMIYHMGETDVNPKVRWASPAEYLQRIEDWNRELGDDVKVEGVIPFGSDHKIVTSQRTIEGDRPQIQEITKAMTDAGYIDLGESRYYNPETNKLIGDFHTGNVVKNKNGDFVPIDGTIQTPTGALKKWVDTRSQEILANSQDDESSNRFMPKPASERFGPGFYSLAEKVIDEKFPDRLAQIPARTVEGRVIPGRVIKDKEGNVTKEIPDRKEADKQYPAQEVAEQVNTALKAAGVKQEELDWLDLSAHLKDRKEVTKQDLKDIVAANNIEITEHLHDNNEEGGYNVMDYNGDAINSEPFETEREAESFADDYVSGSDHYYQDHEYSVASKSQGTIYVVETKRDGGWHDIETYEDKQDAEDHLEQLEKENPDGDYNVDKRERDEKYFVYNGGERHGNIVGDEDGYDSQSEAEDAMNDMVQRDAEEMMRNDRAELSIEQTAGNTKFGPAGNQDYSTENGPDPESYAETIWSAKFKPMKKKVFAIVNKAGNVISTDWSSKEGAESYMQNVLAQNQTDFPDPVNNLHIEQITKETPQSFQAAAHWDEKDPVAHGREQMFEDKDGKPIYLSEETQSDLHQQARESRQAQMDAEAEELENQGMPRKEADAEAEKKVPKEAGYKTGPNTYKTETRVPDAPLKRTWHEFVFKKQLKRAIEKGAAMFAWLPGQTHNERYGLEKHYSKVTYNPESKIFEAFQKGNNSPVVHTNLQSHRQIKDYIGKELAEKLLEQEPKGGNIEDYMHIADEYVSKFQVEEIPSTDKDGEAKYYLKDNAGKYYSPNLHEIPEYTVEQDGPGSYGFTSPERAMDAVRARGRELAKKAMPIATLEGDALRASGQGQEGFYDVKMMNFIKNYIGKWGSSVDKINLNNGVAKPGRVISRIEAEEEFKKGNAVFASTPDRTTPYRVDGIIAGDRTYYDADKTGDEAWAFPITQAMKDSVLGEGQPIWMPKTSGQTQEDKPTSSGARLGSVAPYRKDEEVDSAANPGSSPRLSNVQSSNPESKKLMRLAP